MHAGVLAVFPPLHCLFFLIPVRIYKEFCRGNCQFICFLHEEVWVQLTHLMTVGVQHSVDYFHASYPKGVHLMYSKAW